MAKNKRKSHAAKSAQVIFLAASVVTAECLGREENKHIELRQYRATPGLVGHALDVAAATTATVTTFNSFPYFAQFT
jgi:hypothetical protein